MTLLERVRALGACPPVSANASGMFDELRWWKQAALLMVDIDEALEQWRGGLDIDPPLDAQDALRAAIARAAP